MVATCCQQCGLSNCSELNQDSKFSGGENSAKNANTTPQQQATILSDLA